MKWVQLKTKICTTVRNTSKCLSPCPGPVWHCWHPRSSASTQHVAVSVCRRGTCGTPQGVDNSSISTESQVISFSLVTLTQESYHSSPLCRRAEGAGICKARYGFFKLWQEKIFAFHGKLQRKGRVHAQSWISLGKAEQLLPCYQGDTRVFSSYF